MRPYLSCRAQGIIEYLLLVTAIVLILIVGILNKGGVFIRGTNAVLDLAGDRIDTDRGKMNFTSKR